MLLQELLAERCSLLLCMSEAETVPSLALTAPGRWPVGGGCGGDGGGGEEDEGMLAMLMMRVK